jgi:hypothetical protein
VPADLEDAAHFEDLKVEFGAEVLEGGFGRGARLVEGRGADGRQRGGGGDGVEP